MSETLALAVTIVSSEWDDALGGAAKLRTRDEAAKIAADWVNDTILRKVPKGKACSLVLGCKEN